MEKKTAAIAPFNFIFWAVVFAFWTDIAFLYTRKVYPVFGLPFCLAFSAVELRALLAMALAVLFGALLGLRLGRLGEILPPAAFLILTALHQIGAIGFFFLEQPLSSILNYLSSDKNMGLWAMLENAGLTNRALAGFLIGLFASVALGLAFLIFSQREAARRNWRLRWTTLAGFFFAAVLLILSEQFLSSRIKNPEAWHQEQMTSPLYVAVMSPHGFQTFAAKLVPPREDLTKNIAALPGGLGTAPKDSTAILIVLESFRSDAVDPVISPNLYRFQQENLSFPRAFSGGNATGAAWLAIVDGEYPIFAYPGSPALLLLKKAGFRNSVFASAGIDYSAFRSEAFGPDEKIAEMFLGPGLYEPESDALSTQRLLRDIAAHRAKGPNLHILFLNASHAHYRWPANYEAKFKPYFALGPQDHAAFVGDSGEALARYRNRYKNSVNFLDSLFGSIVSDLKARGLYQNAVIVVVGDHGQEFMEHGTLAHGTNLFNPQIHIPLLMKLPGARKPSTSALATQLDIMPTLLDYYGLGHEAESFLAGRSLLREQKEDRAVLTKNVGPSTHKKQVWALSTDKYKFEFTIPLGSSTLPLVVWRVSDSDDNPYVPGKGTPADYRAFLAREFVPGLNRSGAFTIVDK